LPYGSSKDLTPELAEHLEHSGHEALFLSESVANPRRPDLAHLDRISICAGRDDALFFEIEVMPRLRAIRNRLTRNHTPIRRVRSSSSGNDHQSAGLNKFVETGAGRKRA
jgi:hypothetical protein